MNEAQASREIVPTRAARPSLEDAFFLEEDGSERAAQGMQALAETKEAISTFGDHDDSSLRSSSSLSVRPETVAALAAVPFG